MQKSYKLLSRENNFRELNSDLFTCGNVNTYLNEEINVTIPCNYLKTNIKMIVVNYVEIHVHENAMIITFSKLLIHDLISVRFRITAEAHTTLRTL